MRIHPGGDKLVGHVVFGCRLDRRLGAGALAVVYTGVRLADGASVAVKLLSSLAAKDPESIERFQREIAIGRRLRHPNLVTVQDGGCEGGIHGMVMELVEGASLEAVIDQRGRLSWRQTVDILRQVAVALAYLGEAGVVHRDIKPGNILLAPNGTAKLADLGFAKGTGDAEASRLTEAGSSMGSPSYMAPEQVRDAQAVGLAADVYGLGATFFHAVTGHAPYEGDSVVGVLRRVVNDPVPDACALAPDLPAAFGQLIAWSMAKDPRARLPDAASFLRELDATAAAPHDLRRIAAARRRPWPWRWILVTAGVLALLAAGVAAWRLLR